jgi:inner membrane protein
MDVVTQAVLGATAAQGFLGRRLPRSAWLAGALGGYLPDADIFITFPGDSLSTWLIHRNFTHGIGFLPIGAALAIVPLLIFPAGRRNYTSLYLAALLGICTHGVLDATTAFGTMLWWPFSNARISWDLVAIIDPLVTLPLLIGLLWSMQRGLRQRHVLRSTSGAPPILAAVRAPALAALLWAIAYIEVFGTLQRNSALETQHKIAQERGHTPMRGRVLMAPAQNFLFRSFYEHEGRVYADSIRAPWWGTTTVWRGSSTPLLRPDDPLFDPYQSQVRADIARFHDFTQDWMIDLTPSVGTQPLLADARYGVTPDTFESLWKLSLTPTPPDSHTTLQRNMGLANRRAADLWKAMTGNAPEFVPLAAP